MKWNFPIPTVGQNLARWLVLLAPFSDFTKVLIMNVSPITSSHSMGSKAGFLVRVLCITTDTLITIYLSMLFFKGLCLDLGDFFYTDIKIT